jgi:tetratricopeptide (TPR) repeat protein
MRRHFHFLFPAGLLLLTLACFWPVGRLGFIGYDDYDYVYQNSVVQSGLNPESVEWSLTAAHAGNWHPVTWWSYMIDCELFGLDPTEEHWMNLGLHAASVVLLYLWLQGLTKARWRSFLVAALFAAHPLHVQSVAWISERKDVLSGFFFMAILLAYTRYCRHRGWGQYLLVASLLALGLMTKPMLVSVPIVLLLLDFWPLRRGPAPVLTAAGWRPWLAAWWPLLREKVPLLLLCLASCLVTIWAQDTSGAMDSMRVYAWPDRCLHALVAYTLYLGKLVYPVNLAILYPLSLQPPAALAVAAALLLLLGGLLAAYWRRTAQPYLLTGWLWFLVMLLPVIGVVQVGLQAMADRYMYLPAIGLFVALAWGLGDLAARSGAWRIVTAALATASVLVCGLDTRHQLGYWRDNITLFSHVVEVSPENDYLGYFYLGISYGELGQLDAAAQNLRSALAADPQFDLAESRLGNVLLLQKKYGEAEPLLSAQARKHPDQFAAHARLGMALAGQKRYAAAQVEYELARQLSPNQPELDPLLAANTPKADAEATLTALANQLSGHPRPEMRVQAAEADTVLGRYADAIQQYQLALADQPDSAECLNNLAWILATCPTAALRDGSRAVQLAQRACELTQYRQTFLLGTLAAACAEAGQFDDAVRDAQKACDAATAQNQPDLLQRNQQLLIQYQNHRPYHESGGDTETGDAP